MLEGNKNVSEKNQGGQFTPWALAGLSLELGLMIAMPAVLLGLLGKYADERWGTTPLFAVGGILLAIISSTVWIARHFSKVMKRSSSSNQTKPPDNTPQ